MAISPPDQPGPPEALPGTPSNVAAATLLTVSGGMLDAIVWILHGHIFATAMTGNTVLLGVALLAHDYGQAFRHAVALATFAGGILLGWSILRHVGRSRPVHTITLLTEMAALAVVGAAPASFPSEVIVVLVAMTASLQIATFQRIDQIAYNSTFITGNLRTLLEALYDCFHPDKRCAALQKLQVIGPVCAGFFAGVLMGAALAPRLHNHSLWAVSGVLLVALLLLRRSAPSTSVPHHPEQNEESQQLPACASPGVV